MGHFAYLINSGIASNKTDRAALEGVPHISLEGARSVYPLPWICCFRASDLAPYTLTAENGKTFQLQIPVTSVETAVANLTASLPRYERLVGESTIAREYWQHGVDAIKALPHRFITLNIRDFIFLDPRNAPLFTSGFGTQADPLSGSDALFEYHKGIRPRSLAEFMGPPPERRNAQYEESNHNSCVLYCQKYVAAADPALMFERMFKDQKEAAEKGAPGAMHFLAGSYLHGRGTPKNVEEGLRWLIQAAEAGWGQSARMLANLYDKGGLGVAMDKQKAAHWKKLAETCK